MLRTSNARIKVFKIRKYKFPIIERMDAHTRGRDGEQDVREHNRCTTMNGISGNSNAAQRKRDHFLLRAIVGTGEIYAFRAVLTPKNFERTHAMTESRAKRTTDREKRVCRKIVNASALLGERMVSPSYKIHSSRTCMTRCAQSNFSVR